MDVACNLCSDNTMTTLNKIADQHALIRSLSRGAAYLLRWSIASYAKHLGHEPTTADLREEPVSRWLAGLQAAPATRAEHRTHLLTIWRYAARQGLCQPPGEVRRERIPEPQPEAWTLDELGRLLAACDQMPEGGDYLRVEIQAAFESGIRKSDLHGLRREQIGETISGYRMSKTGFCHEPRLRPETVAAILARPGTHPLACPWGAKKYRRLWALLRGMAGVDGRGGCQRLRRTGATWVAVEHGMDAAREFLGHRTPQMVHHYVDRTIYRPRGWLPPMAGER